MDAKYSMTPESGLYRIKALVAIPTHGVAIDDVGGLIAGPHNLAQDGACWVGVDAAAVGMSRVAGDALLSGTSVATGNAIVCGTATLEGSAIATSDAFIASGTLSSSVLRSSSRP